jgi:hypothetical protein
VLESNISRIYATAKLEIKRKSDEITRLRRMYVETGSVCRCRHVVWSCNRLEEERQRTLESAEHMKRLMERRGDERHPSTSSLLDVRQRESVERFDDRRRLGYSDGRDSGHARDLRDARYQQDWDRIVTEGDGNRVCFLRCVHLEIGCRARLYIVNLSFVITHQLKVKLCSHNSIRTPWQPSACKMPKIS